MSGLLKIFSGVKRNVVVLGIASFFTDISSEMLYPIVPIFLTSVLGAPMSIVGLIEGIAESTASILKALSGWFSDVIGKRRPIVIAGYLLSSLAKPLLFFSCTWHVVLSARFADRFGKGIRTSPRDAMIADVTDISNRGKAFGFHRALDSLGACIGPLLAIWFLAIFKDNLRVIFLIAFVPAVLAVLTLIFFLREKTPVSDKRGTEIKFIWKPFSPNFYKFLAVSSVFAMGNSSDAFLIMRSKQLGLSVTLVILAYVLYNISYALSSTPFGILSDRMPRKKIMIIGYLVYGLVYVGFALAGSPKAVWFLFPVYGLYIAMTDGVGKALVSDMVDRERTATALGLYHFTLGIFAFLASLIAGLLWTHVSIAAPFLFGGACAFLSCLALTVMVK